MSDKTVLCCGFWIDKMKISFLIPSVISNSLFKIIQNLWDFTKENFPFKFSTQDEEINGVLYNFQVNYCPFVIK